MIWVDYVFIAILAFSLLLGIWRGLVREAISLAALIAAFVLTALYAPDLAHWLEPHIESPLGRILVANVLIFLSVLMVGALVAWLASRIVKGAGLGSFDRMLGGAFGIARGVLVLTVLALVVQLTSLHREPVVQQSKLLPALQPLAEDLARIAPADWLNWLKPANPLRNTNSE